MIENFEGEVKSQLESEEKILKSFIANNCTMLRKSPDIAAVPKALLTSADYSFNYWFIVTNKRIFVGEMNNYHQILSYKVFNREDIRDVKTATLEKKSKFSLGSILYAGGLSVAIIGPFIALEHYFRESGLISNTILSIFVSLAIPSLLVYGAYKLLSKFTVPKLATEIDFRDNTSINLILEDQSALKYFTVQN